jgi:hypothetical protein
MSLLIRRNATIRFVCDCKTIGGDAGDASFLVAVMKRVARYIINPSLGAKGVNLRRNIHVALKPCVCVCVYIYMYRHVKAHNYNTIASSIRTYIYEHIIICIRCARVSVCDWSSRVSLVPLRRKGVYI